MIRFVIPALIGCISFIFVMISFSLETKWLHLSGAFTLTCFMLYAKYVCEIFVKLFKRVKERFGKFLIVLVIFTMLEFYYFLSWVLIKEKDFYVVLGANLAIFVVLTVDSILRKSYLELVGEIIIVLFTGLDVNFSYLVNMNYAILSSIVYWYIKG